MGKSSYLDTYETSESLLRCCPSDIRKEWIKLYGKLKLKNAAPDFSRLIELFVKKADINLRNSKCIPLHHRIPLPPSIFDISLLDNAAV